VEVQTQHSEGRELRPAQALPHGFYHAFQDRFRGSLDTIYSRLRVYLPFIEPLKALDSHPAALDLGCGRGEWLELLTENGFDAQGVDFDIDMLEACHKRGLRAAKGDAIGFLKGIADESQAAVSGFHIVEHLRFSQVRALIKEALRVLRPGGLLILETPNPENLIVSTLTFYFDPTHRHPIPSELLSFLTEYYGFARVKVIRLQETRDILDPRWVSLSQVLNSASPDYATIAQKFAHHSIASLFNAAFDREYGLAAHELIGRFDRQLLGLDNCSNELAARLDDEHNRCCMLEARLDDEHNARMALEARVKEDLAAIYASTSWRITAPLRNIGHRGRSLVRWSQVQLLDLAPGWHLRRMGRSLILLSKRFVLSQPYIVNIVRHFLRYFPGFKTRSKSFLQIPTLESDFTSAGESAPHPSGPFSERERLIYRKIRKHLKTPTSDMLK
jgi:SAM-dependent methyltransferase